MNIRQTPLREFVILSCARTGSTQLQEYIDQFPGTKCFGEVFKHDHVTEPQWEETSQYFASRSEAASLHRESALQFWLKLRDAVHIKHRRVGAKIFYYHREGGKHLGLHTECRDWNYSLNAPLSVCIIYFTGTGKPDRYLVMQFPRTAGKNQLQPPDHLRRRSGLILPGTLNIEITLFNRTG